MVSAAEGRSCPIPPYFFIALASIPRGVGGRAPPVEKKCEKGRGSPPGPEKQVIGSGEGR